MNPPILIRMKLVEVLRRPGPKRLFYHRDTDGTASAAQLLRLDKTFRPVPLESANLTKAQITELTEEKPQAVVFVDLPVDQINDVLQGLAAALPETIFLILDHHIMTNQLTGKNITSWNPRQQDPEAYIPSSAQVYYLLKVAEKQTVPWIAGIGVIGDYGHTTCADILDDVKETDPQLLQPAGELADLTRDSAFQTTLAFGAELVNAAITVKGADGTEDALAALVTAPAFEVFVKTPSLRAAYDALKRELKNVMTAAEKKAEINEELNVAFYPIESTMSLAATVATLISEKYPDRTILIRKRSGNGFKVSLRNQAGRINVGELAKRASIDIGSGGGHEKAAGAFVVDWEEFHDRVLAFLEEWQR
ncbi:MAG: hypothetical protein KKA90_03610 [Nanoarchaeota archaeon]|nr:hypothetical protein [Nanoarchaeota archaeon]